MNVTKTFHWLLFAAALIFNACKEAQADLFLSIDNFEAVVGTQFVTVPIKISGSTPLNSLSLSFGLGGGTPGTALVTGFSLDQTIWDSNPAIGSVLTPALTSVEATPQLPAPSTIFDFSASSPTSSVNANGVAIYLTLDVLSESLGSIVTLNPDLLGFPTSAFTTGNVDIPLTFQSGTLTIVAVPEPYSLLLILVPGGIGAVSVRKRIRRCSNKLHSN